ncbi:putative ribonuclease H-like domain-containing protein, partial [Tanacetum coccineum]
MIKMLQNINREDLETLWKLVKAKHGNTRLEDDYERMFWGDLKVMFEPGIKSEVWRSLQGYKVTVWKMFDSCGVLLKILRKNNMYSVNMKNIVPKESLTCLVAKATLDESMLWHRRLGHINFKTINKLVKDNLVRSLPSKHFENNQTCVACLKGKQLKASC